MASAPRSVEPNRPDVLDEVFDGEAVLVNMRTGRYYALNGAATEVWELIVAGETIDAIAATLAASHDLEIAELERGVVAFVGQLSKEALVRGDVDQSGDDRLTGAGGAFAPSLQIFTDMEDLLLLDPIHEVDLDGSGWPSLTPAP